MDMFTTKAAATSLAALSVSLMSSQASASIDFYTTEASWLAEVQAVETLITTASGVATADEVGSAPASNINIGDFLTFSATNTGLSRSFTLEALETDADFTFDDDEGPNNTAFDNALSPGDIDNYEDDDWEINITSGPALYGFAFILRDNHVVNFGDDTVSFFDAQDNLIGSVSPMPDSASTGQFVGFVSSDPIARIVYDDDIGADDIAIADFSFATTVPTPSSAVATLIGIGAVLIRRRKN